MSNKRPKRGRQRQQRLLADPGPTLVETPAAGETVQAQLLKGSGRGGAKHSAPECGQSSTSCDNAVAPLAVGTILIADYEIVEVVAAAADSLTYRAVDVSLGMPIVIKEFAPATLVARSPDGTLVRSAGDEDAYGAARVTFLEEARLLVRFRHANIVRAHRVFESNKTAYIVLDYEPSRTLGAWLAELGRPPTQRELDQLLVPLLSALASVHGQRVVHADLTPTNILIRDSGSPILINFGNARDLSQEGRTTRYRAGAPRFAPPELTGGVHSEVGPWSDLYALASICVSALTAGDPRQLERRGDGIADPDSSEYRVEFLQALAHAQADAIDMRPQSVEAWSGISPTIEPAPAHLDDAAPSPSVRYKGASDKPAIPRPAVAQSDNLTPLHRTLKRVAAALPELQEETDIPRYGFESLLLPAAIIAGLIGALLFGTGMHFASAAVCEVASAALLFIVGYLPLNRFLSHTTSSPGAIERRVERATQAATWMIAAMLTLLAINPLFVGRYIATSSEAPVEFLSAILGLPAMLLAMFGWMGTPLRRSFQGLAFAAVNVVTLLVNVSLFVGFTYVTLGSAALHPAVQVNRYLYIASLFGTVLLGSGIIVARLAARQRIKQAQVML